MDIHFLHVRSAHEDALPLVVTHGWPGSTVEQLKIIDPLTRPTDHGASASDAFHPVIPSLPGYGFSGKPTETGWDPVRIARAWIELMHRLGYTRYVAQGGDRGNSVTEQMALAKPAGLLGPVLYFVDADGRIRHHHFGEEDYERSERVIQQLLAEAGRDDVDRDLVSVEPGGVFLAADWTTLRSPETYVGYARATGFASPTSVAPDRSRAYDTPSRLALNQWALAGEWTVGDQITTLDEPGGRIVHRFHGRDLNLVLGGRGSVPVRFRVRVDGAPPEGVARLDIDERDEGTIDEERLHQLIRQDGPIADRTAEITFLDAGAQAYVFTFG